MGLVGLQSHPVINQVRTNDSFSFQPATCLFPICTERGRSCGLEGACSPHHSSENSAVGCRSGLHGEHLQRPRCCLPGLDLPKRKKSLISMYNKRGNLPQTTAGGGACIKKHGSANRGGFSEVGIKQQWKTGYF